MKPGMKLGKQSQESTLEQSQESTLEQSQE
jgi:hypothetical protein